MKKSILFPVLLSICAYAGAQQQIPNNSNRVIINHRDGTTQVYRFSDLQSLEFDHIETPTVMLTVVSGSVSTNGFSITAEPSESCASYTLTCSEVNSSTPEETPEIRTLNGTQTVAYTDLQPGTEYRIEAIPSDIYGITETPSFILVSTEEIIEIAAPKVGDYYYSDGTWSDGGLISIDLDGQNASYADPRPMPLAGKTVLGIVCSTDPNRMAQGDIDEGYTHGYVISCKNIVDPTKENYSYYPETVWYGGKFSAGDETQVVKLGSSCYARVTGREDTKDILEAHPGTEIEDCPMFYRLRDLPQAPASSSGWFVPSVGQLWDCLANLCSGQVASVLKEGRALSYDFTWYFTQNLGFNVKEKFMEAFANIPDTDKDEILMDDGQQYISMRTSTRYDEESTIVFNIGTSDTGLFEGMAAWRDEDCHARAFLAF